MPQDNTIERLSQASVGARRRGRPPGSKNRPKAVISIESVKAFRDKVGPYLSPEDSTYLVEVLTGTKDPELQKDMDIFLALQFKALLPQLAEEIKSGNLTREATSRSSIVKELLSLRFQMEKHGKDDAETNQMTFIQNIFNARGIDDDRLRILVSRPDGAARQLPSDLSGGVDRDEEPADDARAISGSLPE